MENIMMPLIGGLLIGISSTTVLGGLGRITGISEIISSVMFKNMKENYWRYAFLLGLLSGGGCLFIFRPELFEYRFDFPVLKIIVAGLLVGFGTRLGSGCTSGHGVCGLARMTKRSIIATFIFMFFGILTVAFQGFLS